MRKIILAVAASLGLVLVAGCGTFNESNHYNLPPVAKTYWGAKVTRIATPQFYPVIIRICLPHQVGVYENPDSTQGVWVLSPDPNCPK